jgi:hypothetical protein
VKTTDGPLSDLFAHERTRWARKHPAGDRATESMWWAPQSRGWWIAILFGVGSILFALGALPLYASAVGPSATSITFFVGSIFFTSAGTLQYREAVDAVGRAADPGRPPRRWLVWAPGHLGWTASAVQLAGTLWFNLSTGYAIHTSLSAATADARVWRPDALGSIAFLVASTVAWVEVCHGWWAWWPRSIGWWITVVNLLGSIAFGVSALASYVVPTTDSLRNVELSNLGTFVGAIGFLVGAVLLLPERVDLEPHERPATGRRSAAGVGGGQPVS